MLSLAVLSLAVAGFRLSGSKPDVVLIVIDTLRADHLPFYGYSKPTAPFLSDLAARGVVFESAYSTSAWTAPASASLLTGMYPLQHGVVLGRFAVRAVREQGVAMRLNRVPERAETLAEAMRGAGYSTHAVVENANIRPELGFDQGFDTFHPLNPSQRADDITDKLAELRDSIRARRPYFLYLHYMDPHRPYTKNPELFDPATRGDERSVSAYDSEIRHVDAHIRRSFEAFSWSRDTVVVVTADHGEELGEREGFWGHANSLFSETLNVPLLFFGQGVSKGVRVAAPVSHVDVLPTLRGLAGAPDAPIQPGVSLWPVVEGSAASLPERVVFADLWKAREGRPEPRARAAIRGRYKRLEAAGGPYLFDLLLDPRETRNRIGLHGREAEELRSALDVFARSARRLEPEYHEVVQDRNTNEELRALGYVN
jgi:arylsulfatase A-like enzyme